MSGQGFSERGGFMERAAIGVYRTLLLFLPSDFRREHGEECVALFRRTLRDRERVAGRRGVVRAIWVGWTGALRGAGEEARQSWSGGASRSRAHAVPNAVGHFAARDSGMAITDTVLRETRHALRRLVRAPGFTVPAALTLALAIGAVTAVFAVAHGVVISPLPYPDSHRLVRLEHGLRGLDRSGGVAMTEGLYVLYRERASTLESVALYQVGTSTVTGDGEPQRIRTARATPSLSQVLRVSPPIGRWFSEEEGGTEGPDVAVLSHAFWQARYGADPGVIGRTITLSDTPFEIIGVMPVGFVFPESTPPDVWRPLQLDNRDVQVTGFNYGGVARMSEGASVDEVRAELDRLMAQLGERFPAEPRTLRFIEDAQPFSVARTLKEAVVGPIGRTLWILLGAAGVVLMIACANVANLFLVRAEGRQRELAVRRALGAGRAGVPALVLAESVLLSVMGGAAGLVLAFAGVELLVAFGPTDLPRLGEVRVDALVVAFAMGLSLCTGLAFGAFGPARRLPLASALHESARGTTASRGRTRARHALMATQVALSMLLLIAGGLMVRSFQRLLRVDPGFSAESVLAVGIGLPMSRYATPQDAAAFHEGLLERVRATPGVVAASATTCLPLDGMCWGDPLIVRDRVIPEGEIPPVVGRRRVAADFFATMGMAPLAGRVFEPIDHRTPTRTVVIDERLAELYFPGEDPIGQGIWPDVAPTAERDWYEVIGVVPSVATYGLASEERAGLLYFPLVTHSTGGAPGIHGVDLLVRTSTPPLDLVPAVRRAIAELDPFVPLGTVTTLEAVLARDRAPMAFTMVLILISGAAALALGLVGIYGVLAFAVSQRTAEIGVRIALGARSSDVGRMVLRQGGAVALVGLAGGLVAALLSSRLVGALLFEVSPTDPATYAAVATGLLVVSLLACWIPARRAARLDAVVALRVEQ